MKRITATEASRNFSDVINRARYAGESFVVERNGESVAEIRPPGRTSKVADVVDFLRTAPLPDPELAADIRGIVASRKSMPPRDRWVE